jgi:hypothetical protein
MGDQLPRTRTCALFQGERLLLKWREGAELPADELNVLVLYLTLVQQEKVDPQVAEGRLLLLLEQLAEEQRPCKLCGRKLYFLRIRGKREPHTADGANHRQAHAVTGARAAGD